MQWVAFVGVIVAAAVTFIGSLVFEAHGQHGIAVALQIDAVVIVISGGLTAFAGAGLRRAMTAH
jgi:hypothetical protein